MRRWIAGGALAALLILGIAAVVWLRNSNSEPAPGIAAPLPTVQPSPSGSRRGIVVASPSTNGDNVVHAVPATIIADCSVDITEELTTWLQQVPNNAIIQFPTNGCYRADTTVEVAGKADWIIRGNNALLKRVEPTPPSLQYPRSNSHLRLIDFHTGIIDGLRVEGLNTVSDMEHLRPDYGAYVEELEFEHGIAMYGAHDVLVEDVRVDAVFGDGIYMAGGDEYSPTWSDGVSIRNATVDKNGRQGIAVVRSRNVIIADSHILHSRRSGIDLEPDSSDESIDNVKIVGNELTTWLMPVAAHGAGAVNNVLVESNSITSSSVPWISSRSSNDIPRHHWTVRYNVVHSFLGSPVPAFRFHATTDVVVEYNVVPLTDAQSRWAVGLYLGSTAQITCNWFSRAFGPDGIRAEDAASSYVSRDNSVNPNTPPACLERARGSLPG